jgi:hypothetical protein
MIIILGVLERTNKQIIVERQNTEYLGAFSNAEGYISKYLANFYAGKLNTNSSDSDINNILGINTNNPEAKIILNKQTLTSAITPDNFIDVNSNRGIMIPNNAPVPASSTDGDTFVDSTGVRRKLVKTIKTWCALTYKTSTGSAYSTGESAVYSQLLYWDGTNMQMDKIATACTSGALAQGGANWGASPNINGTGIGVAGVVGNTTTIGGNKYLEITYTLPTAKQKIEYLRVTPLNGYNGQTAAVTTLLSRMYDSTGNVIGSSDPITGTAIGYGNLNRNSTVKFTAPNSIQIPSAFTYVFFEGNNP